MARTLHSRMLRCLQVSVGSVPQSQGWAIQALASQVLLVMGGEAWGLGRGARHQLGTNYVLAQASKVFPWMGEAWGLGCDGPH